MRPYEIKDDCDKEYAIDVSTSDLTDEEKLERYKRSLENELNKDLKKYRISR